MTRETMGINYLEILELKSYSYFEKSYDRYLNYYRKNKIQALADFTSIHTYIDGRVNKKWQNLLLSRTTFEREIVDLLRIKKSNPSLFKHTYEELNQWKDKLFKLLGEVFNPNIQIIKSHQLFEKKKFEKFLDLTNKVITSIEVENHVTMLKFVLKGLFHSYEKVLLFLINLKTLESICDMIIGEEYPELKSISQMSEKERTEIQQRVGVKLGRKNKKSVPQKKIKKIVSDLLKKTDSKWYVHQTGTWEGKANVSQIYKYIADNHPELAENLSARRMKDRIKLALPDDMK